MISDDDLKVSQLSNYNEEKINDKMQKLNLSSQMQTKTNILAQNKKAKVPVMTSLQTTPASDSINCGSS